jgi:hypothetical protein
MRKPKLPDNIRAFFVTMGAEGGKIGGKARAEKLSPERRSEIARNAVAARWEGERKKKAGRKGPAS